MSATSGPGSARLLTGAAVALGLLGWLLWHELHPAGRTLVEARAAALAESQGDVRVRDPETLAWTRATTGTPLRVGDAVFAADGASTVVVFEAGERIGLGPRSLLVVGPPDRSEAALRRGAAVAEAGGRALTVKLGGAHVELTARSRVALGQGSDGAVDVTLVSGSAAAGQGAASRPIGPGGLRIAGAQAVPTNDLAQLESPAPGALVSTTTGLSTPVPVEVRWGGAQPGDQVAFAPSPDFARAASAPQSAPGVAKIYLLPGTHYVRVEGQDGRPRSQARFLTVASRRAPAAVMPVAGSRLPAGPPVSIVWEQVDGAIDFHVEVAPAPEGAPVQVHQVAAGPLPVRGLPAGAWRWRVQARFAEGPGPWSEWAGFEAVNALEVAPVVRPPSLQVVPSKGTKERP